MSSFMVSFNRIKYEAMHTHFPRECHPGGVVCEVVRDDSGRLTSHLRDGVDMKEGTDDGGRQQGRNKDMRWKTRAIFQGITKQVKKMEGDVENGSYFPRKCHQGRVVYKVIKGCHG